MSLSSVFEILMVDLVLNHASIDNPIVQKAFTGVTEFKDFVITFDDKSKPSKDDLLKVIRARPTPVLTKYYLVRKPDKSLVATFDFPSSARKHQIIKTGWVWTTFSRPINVDGTVATRQVDFNFQNPYVFLKFIEIIYFYFQHGAKWIRLDAIGYLWKKIGSSCLHLPETHLIIQTLAEIINIFSDLSIVLIGEINEPQEKALPYLGKDDILESDMIYLFTHFPLAVHAVLTGTSEYYMKWLPSLQSARGRLFISVLGTHDGMGMKPIGDYLPEEEKSKLQKILLTHGALPNYSRLPGGEKIIYELCSTPWNFINPKNTDEPFSIQLNRYLTILILGLMIKGVPSIYINGLLGTPISSEDLDENRSINRQILKDIDLRVQLSDHSSRTSQIFHRVTKILRIRASESAFDPHGSFTPIIIDNNTVSLIIRSKDELNSILGIVNISPHNRLIQVPLNSKEIFSSGFLIDLIEKTKYQIDENARTFTIPLNPYQAVWLKTIDNPAMTRTEKIIRY